MVSGQKKLLVAVLSLVALVYLSADRDRKAPATQNICSCYTLQKASGIGDVEHLRRCLHQHSHHQSGSSVAIVSFAAPGTREFAIPDIAQFSVYQSALLAAYADRHQYVFRHLNSTTGMDMGNTTDTRWYKIKILQEALRPGGWAEHVDYIAWIDADAIVLDFDLRVEELGRRYPAAHLLASADIRMGLLNTGVLVLRNSAWARTFLQQWWSGPPGAQSWRAQCDQDAFDALYSHYLHREGATADGRLPGRDNARTGDTSSYSETTGTEGISNRVRVLPMRAINSHPPAMVHQQRGDPVLHLMGESTALRSAVFRRAWADGVCAAAVSGTPLPVQLGLHREALQDIAREVYGSDVQALLTAGETPLGSSLLRALAEDMAVGPVDWAAAEVSLESALLTPLVALSSTAHHYCDLLRQLSAQEPSVSAREHLAAEETNLRGRILALVLARTEQFKTAAAQLFADLPAEDHNSAMAAQARRLLTSALAQLLKRAAEAGNDVFGTARSTADKLAAAQQVLGMLEELLSLVDDSSRHVPLHMQALMYQNLGALENTLAATASTGSKRSKRSMRISKDVAIAHLQSAYQHLRNSVVAFDQRRENLLAQSGPQAVQDRSALLEESLSLQLLAGVACGLGKLREGVRRWEQAVAQARSSLLGIELGLRYANLAAVLYNAAVCHVAADRAAQAQVLATEAAGIVANLARQDGGDEQHRALGAHIDTLLAQISAIESAPLEPHMPVVTRGTVRAGRTGDDGVETYVSAAESSAVGGQQEEDEWVECELDEDCDLYEVVESAPAAPARAAEVQDTKEGEVDDVLAGLDLEGMSAEDVEELREVRGRYFRQTGGAGGITSKEVQEGEDVATKAAPTYAARHSDNLTQLDVSKDSDAVEVQRQLTEALRALQLQVASQAAAQDRLQNLVGELSSEVKRLREELRIRKS